MGEDNTYIVQCNSENFDDAQYLIHMFANVIDIDNSNYSIKTFSLDSLMKQRLTELGVSFWEEVNYGIKRASI